ncbi:hypothetical protein EMA8858_02887 [Emticicia aquatica]|uniref:Capsule assembly protein Wzi n=1 Tax=Emticicia aquatica TaxID=1681835 RepID=A0ABN8EUN9_9BACT|nr:capsule assembly Wzi family protein [Emticicia aquatica]CAH0996752.1 hypothetical protein EMA8858_02887 [Emticicia aquatica]
MIKYIYACCLLLLYTIDSIGQNTNYQLESGLLISNSKTSPFWLRSNQYGIVPVESQFLTIRGGLWKDYKNNYAIPSDTSKITIARKSKFSYGYGLQMVVNAGKINQILFPEAYFKVRFKAFELYAGRRREIFGIVDSTLSSGSFIWSGNALPMPKLQLSTIGYAPIGKHKVLAVNMGYAHGWFDNSTALKNSYLHQKWFYAKIGKPSWKINVLGGFNHQVQWGGSLDLPFRLSSVVDNRLPSTFSDYLYLVSGISLNYTERQKRINLSNYTSYDLTNRVGNHIGTIDIGAEIKIKKYRLMLYKQSVYDDGTLVSLSNVSDGLYGFSIANNEYFNQNKLIFKKLVLEVFNSQNQGGSLGPEQGIDELRGRDDYFNHGQFINGWAYGKNGVGSPFILPQITIKNDLPQNYIYDNPILFFTNNNRVASIYGALSLGYLDNIVNQTRFSLSRNWGTYRTPFESTIKQFSFANTTTVFHQATNLYYNCSFGFDSGLLLPNSFGVYFGVKKKLN